MRNLSSTLILAATLSIAACGPRDKDRLDDNALAGAQVSKSDQPDARCTARSTSDEIKRQLFARAAEIRGSNGDNYAKIAGFALIELDGAAPVAPLGANEAVDCRAHATLRLPAGLKVAGGRTVLGGDIGYTVAPGARGMVTLGQSDAVAIPLATLTSNRAVAPAAPAAAPAPVPAAPARDPFAPVPAPAPRPAAPVAPPPAARVDEVARPSFDCRRASTPSERAVCANPSLAALDRAMAAQYRSAIANGGPDDRRLLVQTRDRFLMYRERCSSDGCIAGTYRGRMREIDDIVAGRWQSPR